MRSNNWKQSCKHLQARIKARSVLLTYTFPAVPPEPKVLEEASYHFEKPLGSGSFGDVVLVQKLGLRFAAKKLKCTSDSDANSKLQEVPI